MASFPGPALLGRGVVVPAGRPVPEACRNWPRVTVDHEALAHPAPTADVLHGHWLERRPVVVVLAVDPAVLREPEVCDRAPWELDPSFELARERLQYLVWSNNYDCREEEPVWWHARRAERLGATATGPADVVLPDGSPAWCDGGPRQPVPVPDAVVVHRDAVEAGSLQADRLTRPSAPLAPDQLAAVAHPGGPARVIAPAGSGKTRVLTERLRHLIADRGITPSTITAVAYNKRAADELIQRTTGLGAHVRTLNSLGLGVLNGSPPFASTGAPPRRVIEEAEVRRILESLVTVRRQQNTDPLAAYIDALSAIRLGLADPDAVEAALPDAAGVAGIFERYRDVLAENRLADFDEQIYGAIEVLLRHPQVRASDQARTRRLLVDEFQDLTPAHLLLLRLLAAPTYDVFGVGDDDQVIYSYAGASPEFLLRYDRYFHGAAAYALEVNYRCPPVVVDATRHLLGYNRRRIAKTIVAGRGHADDGGGGNTDVHDGGNTEDRDDDGGLIVERLPSAEHAASALAHIRRWTSAGTPPGDVAVLSRVNSALLALQVTLMEADIACTAPLGTRILGRTGIRAALAYLRIGADPQRIARADVAETIRRPSRRIARNVVEMVQRRPTTSVAEIRRLGRSLSGGDGEKLGAYADDLATVADSVRSGGTVAALRAVRVHVGLGRLMDVLDSSRREVDRSTHGDDLSALEQVAALHPAAEGFEPWLRAVLDRPGRPDGVTLSTVHRVKGQEWPKVVVLGADEDSFPHRLATDVEEERRVFHVAITRARHEAVVVADTKAPSPFCAELTGDAAPDRSFERRRPAALAEPAASRAAREGRAGSRTDRPVPSGSPAALALRAWRRATAERDRVPAYVVFSDAHLEGIAAAGPSTLEELARCRGVGPAKLDKYGDEVLSVLEEVAEAVQAPDTERSQDSLDIPGARRDSS